MVQFKIIGLFVTLFVIQVINVQCKRMKITKNQPGYNLTFFQSYKPKNYQIYHLTNQIPIKVQTAYYYYSTIWQYGLWSDCDIAIIAPFHENIMEQFHLRTSNFLRFYQTIDESYFRHPYIMVHLSFVIPMKNCVKRLFLFAKK